MRRIKLRHLDTLAAFMKTGSVTEAALVLHTTQPNASKSLKQLEEFAGVKLFERSGGRLRPTPEAELLFAHATRLMDELMLFENLSLDLTTMSQGYVNIGILSAFSTALIPMAVERFNNLYPGIQIQVDLLDSDKIHTYVSRGNYDFGLVHHPEHEADLMTQTLKTSSMVCIMPIDHKLAKHRVILASDIADQPFVTYPRSVPFGAAIFRSLSDEGVRPSNSLISNQSQLIRRLVERGRGVALVDHFSVWDANEFDHIVVRQFEPRIPVSVGMIIPKRRPLSLAAQTFVASLKEVLEQDPATAPGHQR
ncbi:LysR family transcriptional regulator [Neorhizobium sp. T6_25]|jgi:DNA-binding transcriptional LysR family regulator|uniref:LysR family transcriptional regulator n=1 Tax=Neorhizobium sp. T6_25 TaxID=2093833 RepID=UPI00155E74CF|nr:LysR substrate-binding domain-containing protein [Neorhizobium sp. T6_25]